MTRQSARDMALEQMIGQAFVHVTQTARHLAKNHPDDDLRRIVAVSLGTIGAQSLAEHYGHEYTAEVLYRWADDEVTAANEEGEPPEECEA